MVEQEKLATQNNSRLSITESLILDSEITDVLFHFDAIMDALEEEVCEPSLSPRAVSPLSDTTQSLPTSPTEVEFTKLGKLSSHLHSSRSNLPSVRELQKQFLLSKGIDVAKVAQSKHLDVSQMRVNVQDIIQQLHVKGSSTSPEPPPNFHRPRRNSKSIQDKISVLTTGYQGEASEETRRSYTPPLIRNKIRSPFLERSKSQDFDSILSEAVEQDASHPLTVIEGLSPTPPPILSVEPSETTLDTDTVTGLINEGDTLVEQPTTVETTTEIVNILREGFLEQTTETTKKVVSSESFPINVSSQTHHDSSQRPEDVPTPSASPDKVFVTIREDYRKSRGSRNSKKDLAASKEEEEQSQVEQKVSASTVQNPVVDGDRKRSAVIGLDDVLLSFDVEPPVDEEPENILSKSTGSNHVQLIIGVRENQVFKAPPRIIDPVVTSSLERPPKKMSHYDRLLSKTHYDHLPPVERDEEFEEFSFRYRSVSDVTSHRVHPVATPPPRDNQSSTVSAHTHTVYVYLHCVYNPLKLSTN